MEHTALQLGNKYRASWLRASEEQRRQLCLRFGLVYTRANDEVLLQQVSHLQQQKYLHNKLDKMERQSTAKEDTKTKDASLNSVGVFALLKKIQQKKVALI